MTGTWTPSGFDYGAMLGTYAGGYGVPSTNPASIGAGVSEIPFGWGVGGFGQDPQRIDPGYFGVLGNQELLNRIFPGFIEGSLTYNQRPLTTPGLIGNVGGVLSNMAYGSGGVGDPTTGTEAQTPEEWVQGGRLFEWDENMQGDLGYIANLFGRSDTPSGIGTPTWSAPQQYWTGLAQQVAAGRVRPTARGWQALAAKGFTPQNIGGVAPQQAQAVGAAGGAGGAAGGRSGEQNALASIAASQAADQAARLTYQSWQMRVGDEQLAMQKAQEAWTRTFQETQQAWQQQYQTAGLTGQLGAQDTLAKLQQEFNQRMAQAQLEIAQAGLTGTYQGQRTLDAIQQEFQQRATEAGLTGRYNGQETQQAQQQRWQQGFQEQSLGQQGALSLLGLQSQLQGPRDVFRYQQLNANTPGGLKDMLAGLAGRYNFAGSGFQGTPGPATLQSRTQDLLAGGQQGTGAPPAGGQDGQGQFALPSPNQVNLANWSRMSPSQQQMTLGAYESQGYYGGDVEEALRRAAPRYAMGTGGQAQVGL